MGSDLKGGEIGEWLVIGWFTPDYRPLAERFAANLEAHGAPFHLFARPKLEPGWSTRQKPYVVLQALDTYPGKTVVLMDVDCIVNGDISPVIDVAGDVGITVLARNMKKRDAWQHWIAAECSSRVVVFRPTEGARAFARRWAERIESSNLSHDEHSMIWAYLASPDIRFGFIDPIYSGREISQLPDGIIVHESAHSAHQKGARGFIKQALRDFERRFLRTGCTSRDKTALAQVVKAG
jgi:hypothetical protein